MVQIYNGVPVVGNADVEDAVNSASASITAAIEKLYGMLANGYRVLTIDLSSANTDALIASDVVSLSVLSISSGASASIKLFSTSNDPIDIPGDLDVGDGIANLAGADVYLTNTAQSGDTLKLLVFTRT